MSQTLLNLSEETKQRVELAFRVYWKSPFCSGTVQIGEILLAWALQAELLSTKGFADALQREHRIAYQFKTGLPTSPVTFARLTTSSQGELVNRDGQDATSQLGTEVLQWIADRIREPLARFGMQQVRVARVIYTREGQFTYYERVEDGSSYEPQRFIWKWSQTGRALEGFYQGEKWLSWYPQGRRQSRNQNQLHFHCENLLMPPPGAPNRFDFALGAPAQIPFSRVVETLGSLSQD